MMKVFIVDDSALVRERLIGMLSEISEIEIAGQAQNVQEAVESIRKCKPDAAIIDIRMPGGNGIDVLKHLKKIKPAPLKIILTNYPFPQYRKRCMEAGADYFFDKSSEFGKVVEVLKKLIQESKK
jgi:DNA-binding NarL/FixJ family response regulator